MFPEELIELTDFWPTDIILSAVELGFTTQLIEPCSAAGVASECGTEPHATELLLDALVATGMVGKQAGMYQLVTGLREAFLRRPGGMQAYLMHRVHLRRHWRELSDIVRFGQSLARPWRDAPRSEDDLRSFIGAMATVGQGQARNTLELLEVGCEQRILDIGGGPGVYAAAFAEVAVEAQVVILDHAPVCAIARENLAGTAVEPRIGFAEGDVLSISDEAALAGGRRFDLVFVSNLIHSMSETECQRLLERAVTWAAPGGRVAIKDFFLDADRASPPRAATFAINMLVNTEGGRSYTWDETAAWLGAAGQKADRSFTEPMKRLHLQDGTSGILVMELDG